MQKDVVRRGRLTGERTGEMTHFLSSMRADRCIADADILVDMAHVLMLHKQRIIGPEPARILLGALLEFYDNGIPEPAFDERFEDIHAGIESHLIDITGEEVGGRLHIGRSRNDEVATCIRIRLREDITKQMAILLRVRQVLLDLTGEHITSAMPGFTHFQHAQPTTLAHHLMAHEEAFGRDYQRLSEALVRVNRCPLGAAAFASTSYPINREYTADLLGFDGLAVNTMDAVSARDFALESLSVLSIMMSNASRLCEELIVWSSPFVGFVSLDDAFCSTSSIMPQKKNPDTAEIMRAKAASVMGSLTAALATMKALPLSYNRDLQELTPCLWRGVRDSKHSTGLLAEMLATATFHTDRMRQEAGRGYSTATDLADMLVRRIDLPFRTAHSIVGRAVQKEGLDLPTLDSASMEITGKTLSGQGITAQEISEALDVEYALSLRKASGAPSGMAVKIAMKERNELLEKERLELERLNEMYSEALKRLVRDARRIVE
ncbi:MAG TPA: argininosuccinate lyase [Methanoregulaceae archaeon]|nr:argininosuccinate lyase [Methanoregulaceae archaeon]